MEFVGRSVKKELKGHGFFTGTVKSYAATSGLFEVIYEDGNTEELSFDEVSLLLGCGAEVDLVEAAAKPGRKPKKRRRIERKREIRGNAALGNASGFDGDLNENCNLSDGSEGKLELEQRFGGNLRENVAVSGNLNENVDSSNVVDKTLEQGTGLITNGDVNRVGNLKNGIDLNAGFNLNLNDGCDLNVDSNVGMEGVVEKRDCIDLNLDANDDFVENRNGDSSLGGSTLVTHGTQKRGCDFDLNLEVNEEFKDTECDCEEKFKVNPKFEMIEGSLEKERSGDGEEKITEDGNSNGMCKEVYIDINEDVPMRNVDDPIDCAAGERLDDKNCCSSGDLKADNSVGIFDTGCIKDSGLVEVLVKDSLSEARTPMIHGNLGDSGSPCIKKSSRRKRRKLLDNLKSTTTETVLRRSARRGSALNHVSVSDPLSSSAVGAITEEKPVISGCEETEKPSVLPQSLELPPSSQHLNLDGIPVLDLFSIYACLRSFSTLLFLSPFKLEDFVAALTCKTPSLLFDHVHVSILQTLRKHLEWLANEGDESASNCLRSLNWDFLDLITWPIFMVEYFLIHGSGLKPGFDLSCFKLYKIDYYTQPASVKVEILRCLCDDLIEVEAVRSEINRRSLAAEPDMVNDRNLNYEVGKKRKAPVEVAGTSNLNDEVDDDTNDWNSDECCLCKMDGNLICCDGCPAAYHSKCVGVSNDLLPEGDWYCPECLIDRHRHWMNLQKSLRGAEILGIDPCGRLYFKSCGYLLVSDSFDRESTFNYYDRNDLNKVIEVLRSSGFFYGGILVAICKHWDIPVSFEGADGNIGYSMPLDPLAFSETCAAKNETDEDKKLQENSVTVTTMPNITSEVPAETMQVERSVMPCDLDRPDFVKKPQPEDSSSPSTSLHVRRGINKHNMDLGNALSSITARKGGTSEVYCRFGYMNYYSFGQIASSVAEELARKSSEKIKEDKIITEEEIISAQMKTILKKSSKFFWPNIENLNTGAQKEKCGWCFSCKAPADDKDCLFIMSMGSIQDASYSDRVGLQLKKSGKGHLNDVSCQILSIHDRLQGLLLGPWLNPLHVELWRKTLIQASSIASIKYLLLMLEANLRHRALSADWLKHVDSVNTVGSASHVVTSLRSRRRLKCSDSESNPSLNAASGLGMFWWRGGRLSRQVFSWKVLPRSLTSKGARQAGCTKILGILYPENSEYAKRSKSIAWRAAVEASTSAEQLALQVRELDSNIKWDDIENSHPLPTLDKESRKSIKLFKKVIVRRKCSEGGVVKYLLDFGKRRAIPDIVKRWGSLVEELSSEKKKYWLDESYLPLHLLKNFEERRIARKSTDVKSGKVLEVARVTKRPREEKGFMYLFSKAERSEYYKCAHCNKDVLKREAVSCQYCKGFYHKRHARKSAGAVVARCKYTCHRCQNGLHPKIDTKRRKVETKGAIVKPQKCKPKGGKVQSQKCTNSQTGRRSMRLKNKKKALAGGRQVRLKNSKTVPAIVPLRRSPRKTKSLPVQNKKLSKCKKGKKGKSNKGTYKEPNTVTWQKKRTQVYHSYWLNGLLLSRKPSDERVTLFWDKKLLVHSECASTILDQPKCHLCCEARYTSSLNYISCEICGVWFHGEAFGLNSENIGKLIGFKCHMCREGNPPVCPHLEDVKTDVPQLAEVQIDGTVDCSEEVPNSVPPLSEVKRNIVRRVTFLCGEVVAVVPYIKNHHKEQMNQQKRPKWFLIIFIGDLLVAIEDDGWNTRGCVPGGVTT
ncbi:hypothetical protein ACFX2I_007044 [Malus domestica]